MGIIQKQALKGTVFLYLGVVIGFISTLAIAHSLSTSQNGLISLLVSYSDVMAQTITLGFSAAIGRLFPYFRANENKHNGFFFILLLVILLGSAIGIVLFYSFKPLIINLSKEKSSMFISYVFYLLPLMIFRSAFILLDKYYTVLYNAVIGIILKEFVQRILILITIFLFFFELISFSTFIIIYVSAFCLPAVIIFISLWLKNELSFKPQLKFISPTLWKSILSTSFYGLLIGFSTIAILRIDVLMISDKLGLSLVGIYTITFYFATLVKIPSRALTKITATIFADSWKEKDYKMINTVYYKSSLHQFVIALLLFVGIWANIENIFAILPKDYAAGRYVIFFIGLSALVEMISGGSNLLISTSPNYRYMALFMFFLLILLVVNNLIFIPLYGINGAALASLVSTVLFTLFKYIFILKKYKMHCINFKHLIVLLIGSLSYLIAYFLPVFDFYIVDIAIRSSFISLVFGLLTYFFKISEEINEKIDFILTKISKILKMK